MCGDRFEQRVPWLQIRRSENRISCRKLLERLRTLRMDRWTRNHTSATPSRVLSRSFLRPSVSVWCRPFRPPDHETKLCGMMQATLRTRFLQKLSQLVGWFFGVFWAMLGASALPRFYDRIGYALAAGLAIMFFRRLWRYEPPVDAARAMFRMPIYLIAVVAELVGMYAAALLLPRFGAGQQVYSAIGCIVGLHFIGLWFATKSQQFLHVCAGMCCVSLLSIPVLFAWHTIGLRYLLLGAGNAAVLWFAVSGTAQGELI